ncbi:MAG TPA: carbohydrate binding domain-containing protein [Flavobacteriales bacterium]|nr:carbohydrate binding domain-containing protein [Flavobacteriales bacterium]
MRHFTLLAFTALLSTSALGQVIFTSGFEDWAANLPTDWYGSKSNLPQSGVEQVTTNVHGGANAVRLIKASTGHQRFTTQVLSVTANQEYEINFWVRGEGQIRVGLYDGRPTGSGYASYNPTAFVTITGNTWQEVTLNMTAAVDAGNAEFILSVQSTVAPEHLVVDDVTITALEVVPPTPATIVEIQETTAPDGASPMVGTTVITQGLVSALLANGFYLQDGIGPWTGLFVFATPGALAIGDQVTVTGTVVEFNGQTQLSSVLNIVTVTSGNAVAPTVISTLDGNTEPYESVLVKVNAANCTAQGGFGQFTVNDGSGPVLVDDVIYAHPFTVGQFYNITGVVQYAFSEWRILPRFVADVEVVTGIMEQTVQPIAIGPNPANDVLRVAAQDARAAYAIVDALGRTLQQGSLENGLIEVHGLTVGAYVLTVQDGAMLRQAKLQVQR